MNLKEGTELGSFNFPIIRIVLGMGLVRVMIRREWLTRINGMDWLIIVFCCWALLSSMFHKDPSGALKFSLGLVYNVGGIYFLVRSLSRSIDEILRLCVMTAVLLVPVAVEMAFEKATAYNLFSVFAGAPVHPEIRNGSVRAQGPFTHSILAGTVGAVSFPLILGIWKSNHKTAVIGMLACLMIVFSSSSSGPIMSLLVSGSALFMWKWRHKMRLFRWLGLFAYVVLDLVMKAPVYYIIGRIDLTGGSTGWHRARLIESAIEHIGEWWLSGTDYTRHWMPTGASWSPDHTDITNHYLYMGVIGGLPLTLLLIALMCIGFCYIGRILHATPDSTYITPLTAWCMGAALFSHAASCISVAYFDQSFVFLYLTLAAISSAWVGISKQAFGFQRIQ